MSDLTPAQRLVERITRCQRGLYSYILTLVASPADAEDILQETNLVLVKKSDEWDQTENFQAWACSVARYQVMAYFKRQKRDRHAFMTDDLFDDLAARSAERVEALDARLAAMRHCIARLPDHTRKLITLRYDAGKPIDAIAAETARSGGAIRIALHRARGALLDCIRDHVSPDGPELHRRGRDA